MMTRPNPSQKVVCAARNLATRMYRQRACLVVVSAVDTGRVLVVRRFKDDQVGLPCGKMDEGETILQTALRELHEETGVTEEELTAPLVFQQEVLFEGTLVSVFAGKLLAEKQGVAPAQGFEGETSPFWVEPDLLADTDSRFQTFNVLALFNAGLID